MTPLPSSTMLLILFGKPLHFVNLSSEWSFLMLPIQDSQYSVGTPAELLFAIPSAKKKKKIMGSSLTGEKMKEEEGISYQT